MHDGPLVSCDAGIHPGGPVNDSQRPAGSSESTSLDSVTSNRRDHSPERRPDHGEKATDKKEGVLRLLEAGDRRLVVGFSIQELFTRLLNGTAMVVHWLPSPSAAQASFMQYTAGS